MGSALPTLMPTPQSPLMKALNPLVARLHSRLRYPTVPSFPRSVIIETTSRCNLRCRMCPRRDMRRPAVDMSESLFHSLIDQLAEFDAQGVLDFVALHEFGEPLLHPRFFDFVQYAGARLPNLLTRGWERQAVRGLNVSTNAVLMDEEKAKALLASALTWVAVSMDGATADTYEAMRVGACFEQVSANVRRLLELNRQTPRELPTIAIQVIATRTTAPEFERLVAYWREIAGDAPNVLIELKPYTTWAGQVQDKELHPSDTRHDFLYLNCGRPHGTMVINADGRLALCCYDVQGTYDLGDANDTPLQELWQGQQLSELRRRLATGCAGDLPLCRGCAMTRKYTGDLLHR